MTEIPFSSDDFDPEEFVRRALNGDANPNVDQLEHVQREVDQFDSPGLADDATVHAKENLVLDEMRLATARGPETFGGGAYLSTPAPDQPPVVPGVGDTTLLPRLPRFNPDNPEHLLAPIVIPAWNPASPVVVRNGAKLKVVLQRPEIIEQTEPRMLHCTWHDGPCRRGSYLDDPMLMTTTRGQYVILWWVCGYCAEQLKKAFPPRYRTDAEEFASDLATLGVQGWRDPGNPYPTGDLTGVCLFPVSHLVNVPRIPK